MIDSNTYDRYAADPGAFRADLLVDVDGVVRRFGDVMDPWQRTDFAALDPALLRCSGRRKYPDARMRAWLERARGHSKTTDIAVVCCWALVFATRPLKAYAYAADRDQAQLLRQAMHTLVRLNPWLGSILAVEQHRVTNIASGHPAEGGTLTIEASDVGSSYGILPDLIVADEVTHWEENASGLWHSIISSAAKRSNCLLFAIGNSGFVDSWQWNAREAVRTDPNWYFSRIEGSVASWITPDRLDEQRRLLPPVAFARLWLNCWSSGGGDALTPEDIAAAFKDHLTAIPQRQEGWEFVAGLDLGVSRDCSAICVLGVRKRDSWEEHADHGRIRLAYTQRWRPPPGGKINLQQVEDALLALHYGYGFRQVNFDPWQATHMSQRLTLGHLPMEEVPPTGHNLQRMATAVIEAFNDRRVDLYPNDDLHRDLVRLRVEERQYGFRLTAPRDAEGHGDLGSAFSLAMLGASERAGIKCRLLRAYVGGQDLDTLGATWERQQRDYRKEMEQLAGSSSDDTRAQLFESLTGLPAHLFDDH